MKFPCFFIVSVFLFMPVFLSAQMGPGVSVDKDGKELKWEEGSRDYFVMFKSLLLNMNQTKCLGQDCEPGQDKAGNPQADKCMDQAVGSTYTLQGSQIPSDAYVESAYLVWTSTLDRPKLDDPVDNKVTLTFNGKDSGVAYSQEIVGPEHHLNESDGFTYEGKKLEFPLMNGYGKPFQECTIDADCAQAIGSYSECVPNFDGKLYCGLRQGAYTYRIDVTDFFKTVHEKGLESGVTLSGYQLLGNYTVTGMDCTESDHYLAISGMIGGWALIIVYTSEEILPKKIYIYDDLDIYQYRYSDINVTGFELPTDANVHMTLHTLEGDPGLTGVTASPNESLQIKGAQMADWVQIQNLCNPAAADTFGNPYTEIYNSVSSVYGWAVEFPFCIGNNQDPNSLEYSMDVDTFFISATDPLFEPHLQRGDTNLWLRVSANMDGIYTNFLILSIDTRAVKFDIPANAETPDGREKNACTCSNEKDMFCDNSSFYFMIKVQNWGDNAALNVKVKDELSSEVNYVSGTTEMATEIDDSGNGKNWEIIPDGEGGTFPLSGDYIVKDLMEPCNLASMTCTDSVLIRFKVKPRDGLPKNAVIKNSAEITDNAGTPYKTNSSVPVRLTMDAGCDSSCTAATQEKCGGISESVNEDTDNEIVNDSSNTGEDESTNESSDDGSIEDEEVGCGCTIIF
ncbi:MAG TPA: hypothetical protein PLZ43_16075 [bacterium]|nr:hypothetical protein [bacterium]